MFVDNTRRQSLVIIAFMATLLSGCYVLRDSEPCKSPEGFSDDLLIGEWQATYGAGASKDKISLNQDQTYEQYFTQETDGRNIVTSGAWWTERSEDGLVYLHLEGMRLCNLVDEICSLESGGGGDWLFYDYCSDEVMEMENEVILVVRDVSKTSNPLLVDANGSVVLMHLSPDPDRAPSFFVMLD